MVQQFLLIKNIVDRVFSEYLEPTQEQSSRLILSSGMLDTTTGLTYNNSLMSPEESDLLASGIVIEIDSEQILATSVNPSSNAMSGLVRGYNGTNATDHAVDSIIKVSPAFSRKRIYDAVCDSIDELWPRLFMVGYETNVPVKGHLAEVPESAHRVNEVFDISRKYQSIPFEFKPRADITDFPSGKAVLVGNTQRVDIEYVSRPRRPTHENDSLSDLFIDTAWIGVIILGTVLSVMSSPDVDQLHSTFITDKLDMEFKRIGAGSNLQQSIIQLYEYKMSKLVSAREVDGHYSDQVEQWSAF